MKVRGSADSLTQGSWAFVLSRGFGRPPRCLSWRHLAIIFSQWLACEPSIIPLPCLPVSPEHPAAAAAALPPLFHWQVYPFPSTCQVFPIILSSYTTKQAAAGYLLIHTWLRFDQMLSIISGGLGRFSDVTARISANCFQVHLFLI